MGYIGFSAKNDIRINATSDLELTSDNTTIKFGADDDVTITHDPDDGLIFKSIATADDNPFLLTIQTGETDLAANDVIGKIQFQAPDEGTGTDANLVSAAIQAVAEGDFSSSSNATSLQFMTGSSEAAATKMTILSSGNVGIGTSSPARALSTSSSSVTVGSFTSTSASGGMVSFVDPNTTNDVTVRVGSIGNNLVLQSGGSTAITLDSSQNIGIGTTTIGDRLVVQGTSSATASIVIQDPTANDYGSHFSYDDANSKVIIGGLTNGTKNAAITISRDSNDITIIDSVSIDIADGVADNAYAMTIRNNETTDDRSYGLQIKAGSTGTDKVLDLKDHAGTNMHVFYGNGAIVFNENGHNADFRVESNNAANMIFVDGGNDHVCINTSTDFGGVLNVKSSDNTTTLALGCTDTDANAGPILVLKRDVTGADDDLLGRIRFDGKDASGNNTTYARLDTQIKGATNGSESAEFTIKHLKGGSEITAISCADDQVTINDDGADLDFRVEGTNHANAFFVNGEYDGVAINSNAPISYANGQAVLFIEDDTNPAIAISDTGQSKDYFIIANGSALNFNYADGSNTSSASNVTSLLSLDNGGTVTFPSTTVHARTSGYTANWSTLISHEGTDTYGTLFFTGDHAAGGFVIKPNSVETFRIESDGKLTTRTAVNDYALVVKNSNNSQPYLQHNNFSNSANDNNAQTFFDGTDTATARVYIYSDGDIVNHDNSYGALSDERIKQDIVDANSQWDDIKAVKVRNFKKKDDVDQYGDKAWSQIGVIAQELETVSPKLIKEALPSASDIRHSAEFGTLYTKDDAETQDAVLYTSDDEDVKSGEKEVGDIKVASTKQIGDVKEIKENVKKVSYSVLYMKAIKALQEAMTRIETLEAKVTALEGS